MAMGVNDTVLAIIDELYASTLDETRLSIALRQMAQLVGASGGTVYRIRPMSKRVAFSVRQNFEFDPFSEDLAEFREFIPQLHRRTPLNSMDHVHNVWPMQEMAKSNFYHDILKPQGLVYGIAGMLSRDADDHSVICLARPEQMGVFADSDIQLVEAVIPHLSRALQVTNAIGAIKLERELYAATLDGLSVGVILTDGRGKPIRLNRAAEEMIAGHDGLAIRAGRLAADMADENRALERLVGQAVGAGRAESFQRGGACRISRPSGALPWLVQVTPCGDSRVRSIAPLAPACVILVRDAMRGRSGGSDQLRQIFALTGQESKVALGVAEGRGLAEVAQIMGLSALTVRNHLQRVFAKTGTNRQAELARLVAAFDI